MALNINISEEQKQWLDEISKLIENKNWKTALDKINEIQKKLEGPHTAIIFIYRGLAQQALKEEEKAGRSFSTALSIVNYAPKSDGYSQLIKAKAAQLLSKKDVAKEAYALVLALDKNNSDAKKGLKELEY